MLVMCHHVEIVTKTKCPFKDEISEKYTALSLFSAHTFIHIYVTPYVSV